MYVGREGKPFQRVGVEQRYYEEEKWCGGGRGISREGDKREGRARSGGT